MLKIKKVGEMLNSNLTKMKKSILSISGVVFITMLIITSCVEEEVNLIETENEVFNEDLIPQKLSFQKVDMFTRMSKKPMTIVEWDEWGRAAKDCDGWGLCNAVWFPELRDNEKSAESDSSNYSTLLEFDYATNKYYIDILLSAPVPEDVPIEEFPLPIDESFILYVEGAIGQDLTFPKGEYHFDGSLGEFGGFRIYLD